MNELTIDKIYDWLGDVKDPEIPVLSLVDLGVIREVEIRDGSVKITLTPTFVGCPALTFMQQDIHDVLSSKGVEDVQVEISYNNPWTSDLITPSGREALKKFGLAPPPSREVFADLGILEHAECPRCGNTNTELRNLFGPTLCRSIHFCRDCREAFQQFKPV